MLCCDNHKYNHRATHTFLNPLLYLLYVLRCILPFKDLNLSVHIQGDLFDCPRFVEFRLYLFTQVIFFSFISFIYHTLFMHLPLPLFICHPMCHTFLCVIQPLKDMLSGLELLSSVSKSQKRRFAFSFHIQILNNFKQKSLKNIIPQIP